jgi:hypothetical protein
MDLAETAAVQEGVFSRVQAKEAGYSAYRIRRQMETEQWVELYGGRVLRSSYSVLSATGGDRAALLATGLQAHVGRTISWPLVGHGRPVAGAVRHRPGDKPT